MKLQAIQKYSDIYLMAENDHSWETSDEGHMTSQHLKWGPLPPNDVGKIAQYFRKGEGRNDGKDGIGL